MASINDLATAAVSALATTPTPQAEGPPPSLPDPAQSETGEHGAAVVATTAARGALVVLEGLDRSGKTTQVKLLEQRFVELGRKVKVMRFPGMCMLNTSEPACRGAVEAVVSETNSTPQQ
jgi:dTMP kinase